ncbi:helix-turn-helix transcriptional regulator [Roseomonas sp. KE0001]|uniref:helix-turn-helix transcriptional regulator n=1 Tax=Roseomonas sp. KE0001 TaxID=2479201 RepID=UPI0018DF2F43|nr:helix-turn-helix transcriptional regulator [Roseomonas sp. KE0001]MBI0436144.1 XRE family transcriptional regulator [Roseomonas sp. KE0001]
MPRVRRPSTDERIALRVGLNEDIAAGGLEWSQAVRRMRQALGMTQARFAQAFKLTRRLVVDLEAGRANPTAETLAKIGKPFGYQVGFVLKKAAEEPAAEDEED